MGSLSITDSVTASFFGNYMLNQYDISESQSGWIMTVASAFYTTAVFTSGFIGSSKKVILLILAFNLIFCFSNILQIATDGARNGLIGRLLI